jgi:hypothetical protein
MKSIYKSFSPVLFGLSGVFFGVAFNSCTLNDVGRFGVVLVSLVLGWIGMDNYLNEKVVK